MTLDEAREALKHAAVVHASAPADLATTRALCDAASTYASERLKGTRKGQMREGRTEVLPFGRSKGVSLDQAPQGDLVWVREALEGSIADELKSRWREANQRLLEAIDRELETR